MPDFTPRFGLEKPLQNEAYNIDVFNANADRIDELALTKTSVGEPGGIATLGADGKVLPEQLPSQIEVPNATQDIKGILTLGSSGGAARYGIKSDVGLGNVDNIANIDSTVQASYLFAKRAMLATGATVTNTWFKMASILPISHSLDYSVILHLYETYVNNAPTRSGILKISFRISAAPSILDGSRLPHIWWEFVSGFDPANFVLVYSNQGEVPICELWVKETAPYRRLLFEMLTEGSTTGRDPNTWTVYDMPAGVAAIPPDRLQKVSEVMPLLGVTAPTGTNTSQLATTAFVMNTFSAISPPSDIVNFAAVPGNSQVTLTWVDPVDVTLPVVKWAGTKIVRKVGSYPTSETDGVLVVDSKIRNQYQVTGRVDTGLVNGTTYYYQAFPYSDTNAINRNASNRTSATPKVPFYPVFGDNTWEQIGQAIENDTVPETWLVGDTKDDALITGEPLTFQIYGKNHDDLTSGGKARFTIGLKNLMASTRQMNSTDTNVGGFSNSAMYTWLQNTLFGQLPSDLQTIVKSVNKKTSAGNQSTTINTNSMKIFLFSEIECFGIIKNSVSGEGLQYPIFTNDTSRTKYLSNGAGAVYNWWNRSPYTSAATLFCHVGSNGFSGAFNASNAYGVCFGFCI